tara:strand:- start:645 stop:848 length:204 start_codon:yes stop_codon:yes gene_type:complete
MSGILDRFKQLYADEKTTNKRLEICNNCEEKKEKWLLIFTEDSCGICKCSIPKKTKLKFSQCPIQKW